MSQLNRLIPCPILMVVFCVQLGLCQSADQRPTPDEEKPEYRLQDLILKARTSHYDPLLGQSAIPALKAAFASVSDSLTG
jgi:hypothetical protein